MSEAINIAAKNAAREAIERGDAKPSSRFFIQHDSDPDGAPVYSLWLVLWCNESELLAVLEANR